jgi:regulatory LuxR family protein
VDLSRLPADKPSGQRGRDGAAVAAGADAVGGLPAVAPVCCGRPASAAQPPGRNGISPARADHRPRARHPRRSERGRSPFRYGAVGPRRKPVAIRAGTASPRLRRMAAAAPPDQRREARTSRGSGNLPPARCPVMVAAGRSRAASLRCSCRRCARRTRCPIPPTPQQRQIVRLASDGLTNAEIGDRLFVSPRTVSSHLHRSYPKLGVAGRHQLRDVITRASAPTPASQTQEARLFLRSSTRTKPERVRDLLCLWWCLVGSGGCRGSGWRGARRRGSSRPGPGRAAMSFASSPRPPARVTGPAM